MYFYWEAGNKSGACSTAQDAYNNIIENDDDSKEPVLKEMSDYEFWRWMDPA